MGLFEELEQGKNKVVYKKFSTEDLEEIMKGIPIKKTNHDPIMSAAMVALYAEHASVEHKHKEEMKPG